MAEVPTQISAYQNRLKKFITPLLLIAIASSSAMDMVRSKSDALWLVQRPDGSGTTCKMEYGEPAETVTEKNGYMWAVQPEIGVGYYDFDKDVYYYSLGIRYERSVESLNYRLHNWPGIINGWSVGISAKMKYAHFLGVTTDVRFAFHPSY